MSIKELLKINKKTEAPGPSTTLRDEMEMDVDQMFEAIAKADQLAEKQREERAKRTPPFGAVFGQLTF